MTEDTANLDLWNKVCQVDPAYLKQISGGRLKGKTDINPMWRYREITNQFGLIGIGWKYTVDKKWTEAGVDGEILSFADISLFIKVDGQWSDPIPGTGGNKQVSKEQGGLYNSDECYKMAITDALSSAMKLLGFGADVYGGQWDGAKYKTEDGNKKPEQKKTDMVKNKQGENTQDPITTGVQTQTQQSEQTGQQNPTESTTSELDKFFGESEKEEKMTTTLIDLGWLQEQLLKFQKAGLKKWTNKNVVTALNNLSGKKAKSVSEAVQNLNQDQAVYFCNLVTDTAKMV